MKKTELILSLFVSIASAVILYFLSATRMGMTYGLGIVVFFFVLVCFMWAASRIGKDKKEKGRVFFWGGVAILCVIVPLIAHLVSLSPFTSEGVERMKMDATRSYFMIFASVFGVSSMARGVHYWADYDLEQKKPKVG